MRGSFWFFFSGVHLGWKVMEFVLVSRRFNGSF